MNTVTRHLALELPRANVHELHAVVVAGNVIRHPGKGQAGARRDSVVAKRRDFLALPLAPATPARPA